MSSILDHKANFSTNEDRLPRSKADRIRTMGRIEPRAFSDSTYIFSAADTKRKNRFQKDYVGIAPGDMLAKERRTGKEPPLHQNIKYEDDNVRFLATGERLRQANPSDRIPRMFELSTQRIQRLNVYPDGTPRSGFPADMSQEQLMQTQMGKAITDITTILKQGIPQQRALSEEEYKRLLAEQFQSGGIQSMIFDREQNTRLRNEALANLPANLAAQIAPGLKGLFGSDVKSIEKIAEDVSIRSAEGRLRQLQDIRSSVDFKKNATELANKLGAKIDIKKNNRDEISEVLSGQLDKIRVLKEDRARAAQEALSRRASISSVISEAELKQPELETKSGAASPAGSVKGASPVGSVKGAPLLENKEDAAAVAYELARDKYTLLRDKMKNNENLTANEQAELLDSAKYLLLSEAGGPVSTTEAELNKLDPDGLLMITDYRIGLTSTKAGSKGPSPKGPSPKGPSPKGSSPKGPSPKAASPKTIQQFTDTQINDVINLIKEGNGPKQIPRIAQMLNIKEDEVKDSLNTPQGTKDLADQLEMNKQGAPSTVLSSQTQEIFNILDGTPSQSVAYTDPAKRNALTSVYEKIFDFDFWANSTENEKKDVFDKFNTKFSSPTKKSESGLIYEKIKFVESAFDNRESMSEDDLFKIKGWGAAQLKTASDTAASRRALALAGVSN